MNRKNAIWYILGFLLALGIDISTYYIFPARIAYHLAGIPTIAYIIGAVVYSASKGESK